MDRLWSPWRTQYIDTFKDEKKSGSCIFCDMQEADINDKNNLLVYKDILTYVVLNLYPYNSGHLLIVSDSSTEYGPGGDVVSSVQVASRQLDACGAYAASHGDRNSLNDANGSGWESNPPGTAMQRLNGFEDRGAHQEP